MGELCHQKCHEKAFSFVHGVSLYLLHFWYNNTLNILRHLGMEKY
jgi:hypothetical protein